MRDGRGTASAAAPRPSRGLGIFAYIGGVWLLAGLLAYLLRGSTEPWRVQPLVLLAVLAALSWRFSLSTVESRVHLSAGHIVVLAAVALLPPLGAGLVGLSMTLLSRGPLYPRHRLFNAGMWTLLALVGGVTYDLVGGTRDIGSLSGAWSLTLRVGLTLVVVDIVQTVLNTLLLAGVIRISEGTPARTIVARLLSSSGPTALGYGVLAFLLVVLWVPVGLGPFSVLLILVPMLGAWWAYRQYAEERTARERTLGVLVAAIETKAPHLEGHSERVAELSRAMAEEFGLGPGDVRDIRVAGMLHDLGQVALPRSVVLAHRPDDPVFRSYGRRGAQMLSGVSFLSGALDGIARHTEVGSEPVSAGPGRRTPAVLAPHIVHVADAYDLLTTVGHSDGVPLTPDEAIAQLSTELPAQNAELVSLLGRAIARRPEEGTP